MHWFAKNWFLLGLIALALFAIPGVILVILRLVGLDTDINSFLLGFKISYELRLSPWVALILLFLPIVLVILYFLKLKRKPIQVPSTFLWKKSVEDLHVNSLFQWLRNNVLLLLQLLALLFLIYSVLGLRFHGSTELSRHYIIMIDNSASMSAKDVSPDRLGWAKQEAMREIDAAGDHDYGMVIVFNSKATTLQTYSNDREKLREAVRSIQQTQRPTRIEEALALAESLANPVRSTEDAAVQPEDVPPEQERQFVRAQGISTAVHIFSDGRFAKMSEAALAALSLRMADNDPKSGGLNIRYHRAGKKVEDEGNTNNLAIIGLNVMRKPADKKRGPAADTQKLLAHVRFANFRSQKATVRVKLDIYVDGALAHPLSQVHELPARVYIPAVRTKDEEIDEIDTPGETSLPFELPAMEPGRNVVLHAQLDKTGDDFPLDDEAFLAVGTMRKAKVLIVGPSNQVLDAFFEQDATKKIAATEQMPTAKLKEDDYRKKARSGEYDLVIFDRCAPADESDMPMANTFFIDRPPPPWKKGEKTLKNPLLMPSKVQHPLLRYLTTIWDVRTNEAWLFDIEKDLDPKVAELVKLPDGDPNKRSVPSLTRIIETSNQAPLLFAMTRGAHTDLVQTFPLIGDKDELVTDWPLQTSFPLFFRNVLYILGNVDDSVRAVSVSAGEPVILRPEAGFSEIVVTTPRPAKKKIELKRRDRNEIVFADTEALGIYQYAVDPNVAEKKQPDRAFAVNLLDINESNIEPRETIRIGAERITTGEEKFQVREVWKWILLLVVALLGLEWYVYHRRIAV